MKDPARLDAALLRAFPMPHLAEEGDKEDGGLRLIVAGSREVPGAALLAGLAGLRAGAGKLPIATGPSIAIALGIAIPEARAIGLDESEDGCLAEAAAGSLLELAEDEQAIVLG